MGVDSSRVLLGLASSARVRLRSYGSRDYLFDSSPILGCKYKRYVRYVSTDEQKFLKQAKYIWEVHVGKYIREDYVDNLKEFKNVTGSEDKKKIKSEEFNKWIAYLLIANSYQSEYASLANGITSQYPMKNNQYHRDLILTKDILKKYFAR